MKIYFISRRLAESLMWRFLARAGMRFSLRSGLEVRGTVLELESERAMERPAGRSQNALLIQALV